MRLVREFTPWLLMVLIFAAAGASWKTHAIVGSLRAESRAVTYDNDYLRDALVRLEAQRVAVVAEKTAVISRNSYLEDALMRLEIQRTGEVAALVKQREALSSQVDDLEAQKAELESKVSELSGSQ